MTSQHRTARRILRFPGELAVLLAGWLLAVQAGALADENGAIPPELKTPNLKLFPLLGLEPAKPVTRHDPSNIIKHDGKYYFWWNECRVKVDANGKRTWLDQKKHPYYFPYASSRDGVHWTYEGRSLEQDPPGGLADCFWGSCTIRSAKRRSALAADMVRA